MPYHKAFIKIAITEGRRKLRQTKKLLLFTEWQVRNKVVNAKKGAHFKWKCARGSRAPPPSRNSPQPGRQFTIMTTLMNYQNIPTWPMNSPALGVN